MLFNFVAFNMLHEQLKLKYIFLNELKKKQYLVTVIKKRKMTKESNFVIEFGEVNRQMHA